MVAATKAEAANVLMRVKNFIHSLSFVGLQLTCGRGGQRFLSA
jgi:hypothetical protein